jgi:CheY-like chemotaxis protein
VAKILVVDDERDIATLIRFLLEQDGHAVTEAHDGLEALAKLGIEPWSEAPMPDLIIIDVMMPQMDGYSVASRLLEDSRTRAIPLLVLTAKDMKDLFHQSPNVAAYIEKPFDPTHLRELILGMFPPAQ